MTRRKVAVMAGAAIAVAALAVIIVPERGAVSAPRFTPRPSTARVDLAATVEEARHRLAVRPADAAASIGLASALLRLARVESDANHAIEAEQVLRLLLRAGEGQYDALRLLGAVHLAQHRFRDAIDVAERARRVRPDDAWNAGVLGDAYLELGDYERAFAAFDTMARLRPDAAAYARVAYAHELQGRLDDALTHMRRAAEATSAHDPESLAWHYAQLAHLHLERGETAAAEREYGRADFAFPGHPYARIGLARVAAARGEHARALALYRELMDEAPTPELAAAVGDLLAITGDDDGAAAMYGQAEALERDGWKAEQPQPAALARMLAERGLKTADAVALAEQAAAERRDIFTMDALAIAYFRAGRLEEAAAAADQALRTGSRNRQILYHAAAIAHARGRSAEARQFLMRLPSPLGAEPLLNVSIAELSNALRPTRASAPPPFRRAPHAGTCRPAAAIESCSGDA